MADKIFATGLIFKLPNENAPDFVKGGLAIKVDEFIQFLHEQRSDWVNISLKVSKAGKPYADLDLWKPEKKEPPGFGDNSELPLDNSELPF